MNLSEKFDQVLTDIIKIRGMLYDANEKETEVREILKNREMELLAMPPETTLITGKNAETRQAQLREITINMREALATAEKEKRLAVFRLEMVTDARRNLESILKIMELERI